MIRPCFLSSADRIELEACVRRQREDHGIARRANAILLLDDGKSCALIAKFLYLDDDTIRVWHIGGMRRDDIWLYLGPANRAELQALLTDRNTPRTLVWRAEIVLATADGCGTVEIMRRAKTSKPTVWRWQARYLDEGVDGLRRDKTRPSRVPPLPRETRLKVITKTVQETPANATHWSRSAMAEAVGISPSSVGR